ncbi:MAG: TetR/AcrR family transcriptional regulator [Rhodothalassiaceae bacterium]
MGAAQDAVRGGEGRRRATILEAATALFLEHGYGATSMDAVNRRAGGSKSTLYAYFGNKERLFAAVVEAALEELEDAAATPLDALSLEEGLRRIGMTLYRLVTSDRHVALARVVIAEAARFPAIGRIYYRRGPARTYRWIDAFLARHGIRDKKAGERFAGALIHRAFLRRLCLGEAAPDSGRMRREVADAVARFLAAGRAGAEGDRG